VVETWKIIALAAVVLAVYGLGVGVVGAPASPVALLVLGAFLVVGLGIGRVLSERFLED